MEGNNNLSKAGSQYGVFSSLFYIIIMVSVGSIPMMIASQWFLKRYVRCTSESN